MDEYDSEREELDVRPADYCDRDHPDYSDSEASDYDNDREAAMAEMDEEKLEAIYNFQFPVSTGARLLDQLE